MFPLKHPVRNRGVPCSGHFLYLAYGFALFHSMKLSFLTYVLVAYRLLISTTHISRLCSAWDIKGTCNYYQWYLYYFLMLGTTLKAMRAERNLSQTTLAKRVGVTQAYIAQLESGVDDNPTLDVLWRLAKAFKVPLAALVQSLGPLTKETHMLRGRDGNGHHFISWQVSAAGGHKRAWVQHRTGVDKDWAGTGRYLNVARTESLEGGPAGNATDFPINSNLSDEQILEAFVTATCAITGCQLP